MKEMTDIGSWRAWRERSVAEYQGDLALIGLHVIEQRTAVEGLPGLWEPLAPGMPGLKLTASAADGMTINGQAVDGTAVLEAEHTIVRLSDRLTAVATQQPGSEHLLAVYDAEAEAVQRYEGLSFYPHDPDWVVDARFEPADTDRKAAFSHVADHGGQARQHVSPGDIWFQHEGKDYRLTPFASGDELIVIFGDKTNGTETYGMGRMVFATPEADGSVMLDFNRAFLPSCAFSHHFNCPLPPAHNRLPFRITAGEQQVISRD